MLAMPHIKNIIIVGASGRLGTPLLKALLSSPRPFNITILSRPTSTAIFPPSTTVLRGDYNSPDFLSTAFANQDALILLLSTSAPKTLQGDLIRAATAAGIPWILPCEFGPDTGNDVLTTAVPILGAKRGARELVVEGGSKWIGIVCGLWFDFSLTGGFFGIDIKNRTARLYDDGNTKLSTSTLAQAALGIAKVLSLPIDVLEAKFKNDFVYMHSYHVSQREMLESVVKATGTSMEEWKVEYVDVDEAIQTGNEEVKKGNFRGMLDVLYGNCLKSGGGGLFEGKSDNEMLKLKGEDLDVVVKGIVENL